ncbi:calcium-binding protein [Streptomyces vietnamensis]|uniref:Uncharacterized protein n=1 Tax=Streptomyces vietnamensis TaxID=362257 RepID=A0A0B5IHM8_9ACTN|nr:calcium-binding protein [Streptomyces vietnamensis]AJF67844.1 hypothetical protein SVTN_29190 [Streptomyces vietnamensis]
MIRNAARALCAASLIVTPLVLSTPAHAAVGCQVNGVPAPGPNITGTSGSDYITCTSINSMDTISGLGGNDYISVGTSSGQVLGGDGSDYIRVGTVAAGQVNGGLGNDYIRVDTNNATVSGGLGTDYCRVGTGNPPISCEV